MLESESKITCRKGCVAATAADAATAAVVTGSALLLPSSLVSVVSCFCKCCAGWTICGRTIFLTVPPLWLLKDKNNVGCLAIVFYPILNPKTINQCSELSINIQTFHRYWLFPCVQVGSYSGNVHQIMMKRSYTKQTEKAGSVPLCHIFVWWLRGQISLKYRFINVFIPACKVLSHEFLLVW